MSEVRSEVRSQVRIIRHRLSDRLLHWAFAILTLLLLATGLLPSFGVNFDWVPIHWISGLVLSVLLLVHMLRSLFYKDIKAMWIGCGDFRGSRPGKYTLAQKLMHNGIALLSLAAVITGFMMLVRIETPFWERNPYWLDAQTWGQVYVIHGLA
ncbi:MAG: cytochrome b/b6 domain-containing protein, partial [Pseudohongiellaceae bacterium]